MLQLFCKKLDILINFNTICASFCYALVEWFNDRYNRFHHLLEILFLTKTERKFVNAVVHWVCAKSYALVLPSSFFN